MTTNEQRVTEMAEGVGAFRIGMDDTAQCFEGGITFPSYAELLAFEQECIKRADKEARIIGVETGRTEYKDRLIAAEDEVLALREALEAVYESEEEMENADGFLSHEISAHAMCLVNEALTNTEESAKRIKAGNAAEVLEEAATVVTETYSDYDGNSLPCFETVGGCADKLKAMAEERRAIAKGEK